MDANDEKPEFQNMPAIADVMEVSRGGSTSSISVGSVLLGPDGGFYFLLFRPLRVEAASTKSRRWTRTRDQAVQSPTTFRYWRRHDGNVGLHIRQEQLDWSNGGGVEIAHIWRQQACTVVEHMGSLHPDGRQDGR